MPSSRVMEVFGKTVQFMGHHTLSGPRTPMAVLNERLSNVLAHMETIVPGSVGLAPTGSGMPHQIALSRGGVDSSLSLQCLVGQGIVVYTPLSVETGVQLRTPRVAPAVKSFIGGDPFLGVVEEIVQGVWEWEEPEYVFGQEDEYGMMYQLAFVNQAPGANPKCLMYKCVTEAELACFLDAFLGTYIWDSICEGV